MSLPHTCERFALHHGDALDVLRTLPNGCVQTCVTSPPYYALRDYGVPGQIGLEPTLAEFIGKLVAVFREVRRVLRDDGTCWINIGDSYSGSGKGPTGKNGIQHAEERQGFTDQRTEGLPAKNLLGVPWRLAFALQDDGWILRQDIIWCKGASFGPFHGSVMPESVTDRCTKSHEYLFLLAKQGRYYYDAYAVKEQSAALGATSIRFGGAKYGDSDDPQHATKSGNTYTDSGSRNLRSVWQINPEPSGEAHFAAFPRSLVRPCVRAATSEKGACPKCGAPWGRQIDVKYVKNRPSAGNDPRSRAEDRFSVANGSSGFRGNNLLRQSNTLGWSPSCGCVDAGEPLPAVVLDPFAGTGTTGVVALEEGRNFIGIDLSEKYLSEIALPRLLAARKGITVQEERNGQAVLF